MSVEDRWGDLMELGSNFARANEQALTMRLKAMIVSNILRTLLKVGKLLFSVVVWLIFAMD